MKIRWEGRDYEVKPSEYERGDKPLRRCWREKWLSLPMRWFEGATRDRFAKLFVSDSEGIMVVSPETFEKMKDSEPTQASFEASKN